MLFEELEKLAEESILITVEREDVCDEQVTGTIVELTENYLYMKMYGDDGGFGGFTVFPVEQVSKIMWGNREHDCVTELINERTEVENPELLLNSLEGILEQLREMYEAVALMENGDESSFDVAKIISLDGEWIKLHCYGTSKTLSRLTKVQRASSFSRIEFDTPYVNQILFLHKPSKNS